MATATVKTIPVQGLHGVAVDVFEECDKKYAAFPEKRRDYFFDQMRKEILCNGDLNEEVITKALGHLYNELQNRIRNQVQQTVVSVSSYKPTPKGQLPPVNMARVKRLRGSEVLDWPVPHLNKRLGETRISDLGISIGKERKLSDTHRKNVIFMEKLQDFAKEKGIKASAPVSKIAKKERERIFREVFS